MPPSRCPGTVQKKTYSPGTSSALASVSSFATVELSASSWPSSSSIATLWETGDGFA